MVALAAINLSREDGLRLAALFRHNRCLFTLAEQTNQPIHQLIAWATLPHIQQAIETITRLENDAHRAAAIEALRSTLDKSEDLVEKRRAACAILRAASSPNLRRLLLERALRTPGSAPPPGGDPPRSNPPPDPHSTAHHQQPQPSASKTGSVGASAMPTQAARAPLIAQRPRPSPAASLTQQAGRSSSTSADGAARDSPPAC